jgi:hypothetical protein
MDYDEKRIDEAVLALLAAFASVTPPRRGFWPVRGAQNP